MNTTIISINANVGNNDNCQPQMMTSLEIAELTGKQHKDVMKAIRNMEPAWEKICGLKFQLTSRTISQHGRKLLRENFTSVHKIYPLAPCSLPLTTKEAELPKDE